MGIGKSRQSFNYKLGYTKNLISTRNDEFITSKKLGGNGMKIFRIYYNDGVYYGSMIFQNNSKDEIENEIMQEIENNNKNINSMYHITRKNFIEE